MIPVDRVISFVWNEFSKDDAPQLAHSGFILHRLNNAIALLRDEVGEIPTDVSITTVAAQAEYVVGSVPNAVDQIIEIVFPSTWVNAIDWIPQTQLRELQQRVDSGSLTLDTDQPQYWTHFRNSSNQTILRLADSTIITAGLTISLKVTASTFPSYNLGEEINLPDSQELLLEYLTCRMCAGRFDPKRLSEFEASYQGELERWKTKHALTQSADDMSYIDDQAGVREMG